MSLDILKERFNGKLTTIKYEQEIDYREKTIKNLEEETNNLSNQVVNLENEKTNLLQELNKARNFETGLFSTKQKEFENKINERKYDIEELESENYSLQEQINKKNERLEYKDKIINNSNNILKEAKNKINRLAAKLQNSKNSKKELKLEIRKTYKEYLFEINNFESQIKDKNQLISEQKQILKEKNKKIKQVTDIIKELKTKNDKSNEVINELSDKLQQSENSLIVENGKFQKEIDSKEDTISELQSEVDILSNKVISLSETVEDKSVLEKRLQEAEQFQQVVKNTKSNYKQVPQMKSKLFNTDNLISMLKEVSKQKQGPKPLSWKQWIEIPENKYLNELNHKIAKKIFNENNNLYLEDERRKHDRHSRMNLEASSTALLPLTVGNLKGYYSFSTLSSLSSGAAVSQWDDLSDNNNHLTQGTANAQPEYNASVNSLQFKRNSDNLDHMDFTTGLALSEFTLFFALSFGSENRQVLLKDTAGNDLIEILYVNANRANLLVKGNDGTNSVSTTVTPADGTILQGTKLLLTCRKKPFNSDDGFGQVEWFINKTSLGTSDDYDENILQTINELGFGNSSTGFEGNIYEMAIYEKALDGGQLGKLQDYFINRTSISV
jgi:myosin heavy subunit